MLTVERATENAKRAAERDGAPCAVYRINPYAAAGCVVRDFNGNWNSPDLVCVFGATAPDNTEIEFIDEGRETTVQFVHDGDTIYFAGVRYAEGAFILDQPDKYAPSTDIERFESRDAALDRAAELARDWIAARTV